MNPDPTSLDRLHDIIPADPVSWWPLAPGWYWLLGFLGLLGIFLVLQALLQWQRNQYRREALAELARCETALLDSHRRSSSLAQIAELLKRTALSIWPRREVASLSGPAWFQFLDRTGDTSIFSHSLGAMIEGGAYDPRRSAAITDTQAREIAGQVRHWIQHHRITVSTNNEPATAAETSPDEC